MIGIGDIGSEAVDGGDVSGSNHGCRRNIGKIIVDGKAARDEETESEQEQEDSDLYRADLDLDQAFPAVFQVEQQTSGKHQHGAQPEGQRQWKRPSDEVGEDVLNDQTNEYAEDDFFPRFKAEGAAYDPYPAQAPKTEPD